MTLDCPNGVVWKSRSWKRLLFPHRTPAYRNDDGTSTNKDTIDIKKHSSRTRRIRPVSTRLSLCDDSSSSPPPSVPSYSSPLSHSASWEGLSELPTQGLPLRHVTQVRPRPPRRHRGARVPAEAHCSENGGSSPLDDGLPDFYSKRVLPDSQLSSLHKAHSLRRKKRTNMLAIFGFRKNRSQTLSNQGPESQAEIYEDRTALENVYTFLQPPPSAARAGSPCDGADGKPIDHQGTSTLVLSSPLIPGIPHPSVGRGKYPFYSPREVSEVDAAFETQVETDKYWVDDKQRTTEVLQAEIDWIVEARPNNPRAERQRFDDQLPEKTSGELRIMARQCDRYWTESKHSDRHVEKQWTVDRHTQRQIDRKIERQWVGGRQIERLWSENRPTDLQVDNQGTESRHPGRKLDRPVQVLHLAQRPLPPYPSDKTPSLKQESDPLKNSEVAAALEWHQQDLPGDRNPCFDTNRSSTDGLRSGGEVGGGIPVCQMASKPEPPSQSCKPNLSKLWQRHQEEEGDEERDPEKTARRERRRDSESQPPLIPEKPNTSFVAFPKETANEGNLPPPPVPLPVNRVTHGLPDRSASQGEEGLRPPAPVKPQRNRKAMSCDAGTERHSSNNVEKPPNRKPPVKKPRLPQNRNKSLDMSESFNSTTGPGQLL